MKRYQKANKTNVVKKSIPLDTQVIIVNNSVGRFYYGHERLEHIIDLKEPTSFEQISIKDLKIVAQFGKGVFSSYGILIVDVLDDEFSLKDVYAYLDLMPIYDEMIMIAKKEDGFDTGCFERFAINSTVKAFTETIMKLSHSARKRLIQALFHAYKNRVISDKQTGYDKVQFVANRILKMDDDIIDILKNDSASPSVHISELI